MTAPWEEPEWLDQTTAWIDERVSRVGDVEPMLARPWSAIVRVPTTDGGVWFKENDLTTSFEPALTERLVRIRPDCLPELIAWEGPRVLTHHVGPRLRAILDAGETQPSWETVLPLYAELQIDFMEVVDESLALSTPDDQPELLPDRYAALGGDRTEAVRHAGAVHAVCAAGRAPRAVRRPIPAIPDLAGGRLAADARRAPSRSGRAW